MRANAQRVPPRTQWRNARTQRDFVQAESLANFVLERKPDDSYVRRCTARLLDIQGRTEEALAHWVVLRNADPADFEAAACVARALLADGADISAAVLQAAPDANDTFREAVAAGISEPLPLMQDGFRHVAICGASFCGSTLVDRILGGLDGVRSIGESHWLTKARVGSGYADADWSEVVESIRFVPCTVCGPKCEVLSPSFRRSLAAAPGGWYRKIARKLDARVLVSADKNLPKLMELDPLLELSALVIFKSPAQAWRSQLDKLPAERDADYYQEQCEKYLVTWSTKYDGYLNDFDPAGQLVFLNFDAFTTDPEPLLRAVCSRLDLAFDPAVLQRTVPGHAIGGNGRSMRRLRDQDYAVRIEPLPDPALEPAHARIIADHAGVQATWQALMALHSELLVHA